MKDILTFQSYFPIIFSFHKSSDQIRMKTMVISNTDNRPTMHLYAIYYLGSFNNYVDKMREGGGSKNVCFCPHLGYKDCPRIHIYYH